MWESDTSEGDMFRKKVQDEAGYKCRSLVKESTWDVAKLTIRTLAYIPGTRYCVIARWATLFPAVQASIVI